MLSFSFPRAEQYLLPTERRVLRTRRHWAILVPNILLTMVVVFVLVAVARLLPDTEGGVAAVVQSVLWYSQVVAVFRLAVVIADWWDDILMITDERVLNVTGLLASRMKDTPIGKITDRDIQHTIIGNILGYGTIIIESAGHDSLQRLRFVPKPLTVYEAIAKLTSKKGLPAPATGTEVVGGPQSIEERSAEWPADD